MLTFSYKVQSPYTELLDPTDNWGGVTGTAPNTYMVTVASDFLLPLFTSPTASTLSSP